MSKAHSRHVLPDKTVSNRHLHVRCIVFEDESISTIPPLVYIKDDSSNGTLVEAAKNCSNGRDIPRWLRHGDDAFLLSNGDRVTISPSLSFTFYSLSLKESPKELSENFDFYRLQEMSVFDY